MNSDRHLRCSCALLACIWIGTLGHAAERNDSPQYSERLDLTYYLSSDGSRRQIRSAQDWLERRRHIVAGVEDVMGPLPRPAMPTSLKVVVEEEHRVDGLIRRKLAYSTDREDAKVKAWLLLPADERPQRRAAVLCLHQTTPGGKDAPVGLSDRPSMHYALELAKRGYVTLSPDYPSFGEHSYDFDSGGYQSGSMKAIYDNMRAIDLLESLPQVDSERIGCIGHSLGGHNSLFTAVFDERIKAVVTSCGFTRFHKYKGGDLRGWSSDKYMPRIASEYGFSPDRMPFDFTEVIAALAPRPVFIVAPLADDNFAVEGVRDVVTTAKPVYELYGQPEHLQVIYPESGHDFPDAARVTAYEFLDERLGQAK
jgi:dipeptidyl aminopeptidase/acylaminoacyl peptidase